MGREHIDIKISHAALSNSKRKFMKFIKRITEEICSNEESNNLDHMLFNFMNYLKKSAWWQGKLVAWAKIILTVKKNENTLH